MCQEDDEKYPASAILRHALLDQCLFSRFWSVFNLNVLIIHIDNGDEEYAIKVSCDPLGPGTLTRRIFNSNEASRRKFAQGEPTSFTGKASFSSCQIVSMTASRVCDDLIARLWPMPGLHTRYGTG